MMLSRSWEDKAAVVIQSIESTIPYGLASFMVFRDAEAREDPGDFYHIFAADLVPPTCEED